MSCKCFSSWTCPLLSHFLSLSVDQRFLHNFVHVPFCTLFISLEQIHYELPCSVCTVAFTYSYLEVIETVFKGLFCFCKKLYQVALGFPHCYFWRKRWKVPVLGLLPSWCWLLLLVSLRYPLLPAVLLPAGCFDPALRVAQAAKEPWHSQLLALSPTGLTSVLDQLATSRQISKISKGGDSAASLGPSHSVVTLSWWNYFSAYPFPGKFHLLVPRCFSFVPLPLNPWPPILICWLFPGVWHFNLLHPRSLFSFSRIPTSSVHALSSSARGFESP